MYFPQKIGPPNLGKMNKSRLFPSLSEAIFPRDGVTHIKHRYFSPLPCWTQVRDPSRFIRAVWEFFSLSFPLSDLLLYTLSFITRYIPRQPNSSPNLTPFAGPHQDHPCFLSPCSGQRGNGLLIIIISPSPSPSRRRHTLITS